MLAGLKEEKRLGFKSEWVDYDARRDHYNAKSLARKREVVGSLLSELAPEWVLDVGANTGEFSEIAVKYGARAICIDGDSQAIDRLSRRHLDENKFFPIITAIDDLPSGRGWMGAEYLALADQLRSRVDVVLMLAVLHHLYISASIELVEIFKFAKHVSRGKLIAEIISHRDPKVVQLCWRYGRNPEDFSVLRQYDAAQNAGLRLERRVAMDASETREIALFSCV
jgi:SAM-dependent methyltransferase